MHTQIRMDHVESGGFTAGRGHLTMLGLQVAKRGVSI